jgi:hypothetical protein
MMNFNIKEFLKSKKILLTVGVLIIIISFFLPLTTSCEDEYLLTTQFGFETQSYYLSIVCIVFVIALSHSKVGTLFSIIFFTIFGGVITIFFNEIGKAGWGKACGHSPTQFMILLYFGHILVVIECLIHFIKIRKQNKVII